MIDVTNDKQVIDQLEFLKNRLHEDDSIAALDCVINRMKDEQWTQVKDGMPELDTPVLVEFMDGSHAVSKLHAEMFEGRIIDYWIHNDFSKYYFGNPEDRIKNEIVAWKYFKPYVRKNKADIKAKPIFLKSDNKMIPRCPRCYHALLLKQDEHECSECGKRIDWS